jgi:hypothetical protein
MVLEILTLVSSNLKYFEKNSDCGGVGSDTAVL